MAERLAGLLIAGTSHVGKSTLAAELGTALGWTVLATDRIARHPGRPWPEVRPHVAEYFTRLSPETIYQFLLDHHDNMWPGLARTIAGHRAAGQPFVFEGSALRPEFLATLDPTGIETLCLHAAPEVLTARIHSESAYATRDPARRVLIDAFLQRSLTDNARLLTAAETAGMRVIDAADPAALGAFRAEIAARAAGSV